MQRFELHPVPDHEPPALNIIPGITIAPKSYEILLVPRNETVNLPSNLP